MSKKVRYILITCGFILFFIIAPLLVMYVEGFVYNTKTKKFMKTGILAIEPDPEGSTIFLNNKPVKSSAKDVKFLLPQEYNIKIAKQGYFSWEKKLEIFANQVSWASPAKGKIFLFKNTGNTLLLGSNVLDFYSTNKNLYILTQNNLALTDLTGNVLKNWSLGTSAKKILVSPNEKVILIFPEDEKNSILSISIDQNTPISLPKETNGSIVKFSSDNTIYFLNNSTLYKLSNNFLKPEKILLNVTNFSFSNKSLYYIQTDKNKANVLYTANLNGQNANLLNNNLPTFTKSEIFSTYEKEVFLLLDNSVYRAGGINLEKLNTDVSYWKTQSQNSSFVIFSGGELSFYNPFQKNISFVSRNSSNAVMPILNLDINYLFVLINNQIQAQELDTRDKQNIFPLYSGTQISKYTLSDDNKKLFVLDGMNLKTIEIR